MKLFHGTTADNLASILANGFSVDEGGANWNVSGENVYFWSPLHLENHGEESESAFQRAADSATFGLGFSKDCRAVVFEVELPEGDLSEDDSCNNMEGAVYTSRNVSPSAIRRVHVSADLSLLKGYFLSFCLSRDMCARELTNTEEKIASVMQKAEIYPEDVEEMCDWKEISFASQSAE